MFRCSIKKSLPTWYELGITADGTSLILSVAPGAFSDLKRRLVPTLPVIQAILSEFKFQAFIPPAEASWGFGPVFQSAPAQYPEWITWQCPLPQLTRKNISVVNWPAAYAVSVSLALTCNALYITDDKSGCDRSQLLECDLGIGKAMGTWNLSVGISPDLCRWLANQPHNAHHPAITNVMHNAYGHIYGDTKLDKYTKQKIWALTRQPKWINFHTEGDACGLDPCSAMAEQAIDRGYYLSPHNVDSPLQQLVLLAGVAALYQQARQDGF